MLTLSNVWQRDVCLFRASLFIEGVMLPQPSLPPFFFDRLVSLKWIEVRVDLSDIKVGAFCNIFYSWSLPTWTVNWCFSTCVVSGMCARSLSQFFFTDHKFESKGWISYWASKFVNKTCNDPIFILSTTGFTDGQIADKDVLPTLIEPYLTTLAVIQIVM